MTTWKLIDKRTEKTYTFGTRRDLMEFADTLCPFVEFDVHDKHTFRAVY